MGKILFGPAGNSQSFFDEGHSSTLETPKWVSERGLDLFEYSFGQGYRMSTETAVKISLSTSNSKAGSPSAYINLKESFSSENSL